MCPCALGLKRLVVTTANENEKKRVSAKTVGEE
jgi:hypothetical protein